MTQSAPQICRLNNAAPILAPTQNWWEDGVTFNAAAIHIPAAAENSSILRALLPMIPADDPRLADGVVAIHYRARPEQDPASSFGRSFIGLALFTPDLLPLYRYSEPVLWPSSDPCGWDALGVEDPRITRLDGRFYMIYAGVRADRAAHYNVALCCAVSDDLLHWQKLGPLPGDVNAVNNKDGVLFPERIAGRCWLLHRPYHADQQPNERAICLAESASPLGPWENRGEVLHALPDPRMTISWPGAGSVPIALGDGRYLMIYHTGHFDAAGRREYDLDAALLDFQAWTPADPRSLVTARIEHIQVPETEAELRSHSRLQVANVIFTCGSYETDTAIRIIYGGADTYTLAAEVNRAALLSALKSAKPRGNA